MNGLSLFTGSGIGELVFKTMPVCCRSDDGSTDELSIRKEREEIPDIENDRPFLRSQTARLDWAETKSGVLRVANGVADRMDRLKCLGNGWVPQVVARILKVGE